MKREAESREQKAEGKAQRGEGNSQHSVLSTQSSDSTQNSKFKVQNSLISSPTLRIQLRQWMQQCRQATLHLFVGVDYETLCHQAHPDFSPIGWHLGNIAYTESLWLLEKCAGQSPQFPQYRRLFAADGLPKAERVHLPSLPEIQEYLDAVRIQVFDYLEQAPLDQQERLWRWLLQHESQHAETIALVLELHRGQGAGGRGQGLRSQQNQFKIQNSKFKI
ncbi:DinB family protein [Kovacikia minuta]|uniref:DinB family protein n=1 Tax=Kovacikia minuta TaxID=2931930 RepID=UPI0020C7CA58